MASIYSPTRRKNQQLKFLPPSPSERGSPIHEHSEDLSDEEFQSAADLYVTVKDGAGVLGTG